MNTRSDFDPITFTKAGFERIQKERTELFEERKKVLERVKEARAMGDLSENGYYTAAKARLRSIDHAIARLTMLSKRAVVANPEKGIIGIGSKVVVKEGSAEKEFYIVGKFEADPLSKKISHLSPIGRALMGRKTDEVVQISIPNGRIAYEILSVK